MEPRRAEGKRSVAGEPRVSCRGCMAQLDCLATLSGGKRSPEAVDPPGRHGPQIVNVLRPPELHLKEGRVVLDPESLRLPEDSSGVFRRELLISSVIVERP